MKKPVNVESGILLVALLLFLSMVSLVIYSNGYSDAEESSEYLVIYNLNGGTKTDPIEVGMTEGMIFEVASSIELTVPEGKRFVEWNTSIDGIGDSFKNRSKATMPGNDLILYAIWEINSHTITIADGITVMDGETEIASNESVAYGTVLTVTAEPKTGYETFISVNEAVVEDRKSVV